MRNAEFWIGFNRTRRCISSVVVPLGMEVRDRERHERQVGIPRIRGGELESVAGPFDGQFRLSRPGVDHGVSEAVYLRDPDDHGLELCWDRPKALWPRKPDGALNAFERPLDPHDLLGAVRRKRAPL